jgi:hypothetical protein
VALAEELPADTLDRGIERHEHQRVGRLINGRRERHARHHVLHHEAHRTARAGGRGGGHEARADGVCGDRPRREPALQLVGEPQDRELGVLVGAVRVVAVHELRVVEVEVDRFSP